ncbi:MAG: trypsin-like peptidase domain-containing protein [Acidobacteriota bacterium]
MRLLILLAVAAAGLAVVLFRPTDPRELESLEKWVWPSSVGGARPDLSVDPTPLGAPRAVLGPDRVAELSRAVVRIEAFDAGFGSGFVVSADGKVITSRHVVEGATRIAALFSDGRELDARKVSETIGGDLALLQLSSGAGLTPLDLGDATGLAAADEVTAIGFPLGLRKTVVTRGIVSAVPIVLPGVPLVLVQIDASINPGNSGGPLFDRAGRVVGVVAAKIYGAESMNYVVPVNYVTDLGIRGIPEESTARFAAWRDQLKTELADNDATLEVAGPVADQVKILGVFRDGSDLVVFVALLNASGRAVVAPNALTVTADWEAGDKAGSGGCAGYAQPLTGDFKEASQGVAKRVGFRNDGSPMVAVRVECPKIEAEAGRTLKVRVRASGVNKPAEHVGTT